MQNAATECQLRCSELDVPSYAFALGGLLTHALPRFPLLSVCDNGVVVSALPRFVVVMIDSGMMGR